MLSSIAQEYIATMLDAYLEDETTEFAATDIGTNHLVWIELENAGIVTMDSGTVTLNPDAVTHNAYPDDVFE